MRIGAGFTLVSGFVLSALPAFAQPAASVAPHAYQRQFENEWVSVTRVHYEPHERLPEHQHPGGPNIYVYLNDGGPVLFKHEHGDSGEMAATRAATKAKAYRLAGARQETHIVENRSDLPSDFLQVRLKTDINLKTFAGRHESPSDAADLHAVEFDTDQIRVSRVRCSQPAACGPAIATHPTLQITLSTLGLTEWFEAGSAIRYDHAPAEYLLVELKSKPIGSR